MTKKMTKISRGFIFNIVFNKFSNKQGGKSNTQSHSVRKTVQVYNRAHRRLWSENFGKFLVADHQPKSSPNGNSRVKKFKAGTRKHFCHLLLSCPKYGEPFLPLLLVGEHVHGLGHHLIHLLHLLPGHLALRQAQAQHVTQWPIPFAGHTLALELVKPEMFQPHLLAPSGALYVSMCLQRSVGGRQFVNLNSTRHSVTNNTVTQNIHELMRQINKWNICQMTERTHVPRRCC